jgi:hypothetical protein
LRSSKSGNDPEINFRLPDLAFPTRSGYHTPWQVRIRREGKAVYRGDDRFAHALDKIHDILSLDHHCPAFQSRKLHHFGDIGACDESLSFSRNYNRFCLRIFVYFGKAAYNSSRTSLLKAFREDGLFIVI